MPQCCAVPLCSSRTSGHRFPRDEQFKKMWLVAIKREELNISKHTRICKKHFVPSDYVMPQESFLQNPRPRLKKDAVPSQFPWTKSNTTIDERRLERAKKQTLIKESLRLPTVSSSNKTASKLCNEIEIPLDTTTVISMSTGPLRIENWRSNSKINEMKFYTGFNWYDHFWLIFNTLGTGVNDLLYYPSGRPMKVHALTPVNEFLLTVIKLRCNMTNEELGKKFDISKELVNSVFITWISFLYGQFKERNIWRPLKVAEKNLEFKGRECTSTVIIDGTEVEIDRTNPVSQQVGCLTHKSSDTLKVLIGISSTGSITFISDAYESSICDRCFLEKCGLSDLLEKNDVILADRGISDVPEFVEKNADCSKKMLLSGIHVESVIGLGKTYRILNCLPSNLVPLGSRIIFVCFMLANFLDNIMDSGKMK